MQRYLQYTNLSPHVKGKKRMLERGVGSQENVKREKKIVLKSCLSGGSQV